MKRGIAIVLVLLMVLSMAACGGKGAVNEPESGEAVEEDAVVDEAPVEAPEGEAVVEETAEEADAEESAEESVPSGNVTVTIPEGWEPIESAGMLYAYQKGSASFMLQTEPLSDESLDAAVDEAKGVISGTFDNVEYVGGVEAITVAGLDARKFIYTSDLSGFSMEFEYVFFFTGGDIYVVTFSDLDNTFDDNAADFQAILDSIAIG